MESLPCVLEYRHARLAERSADPGMKGVARPEIEVSGEDRRDALRLAIERAIRRSRRRRRRGRGRKLRRGGRAVPRPARRAAAPSSTRGASSSRAAARTARRRRPRRAMRGMLRTVGSEGHGSNLRSAQRTGKRLRIMLPNLRRLPSGAAMSTATPSMAVKPGSAPASAANWSSPLLPSSVAKLAATSCRHSTSNRQTRGHGRRSAAGRPGRRCRGTTARSR